MTGRHAPRALAALATLALAAPAVAAPSAGSLTTLACGATITADTRLANDLLDCPDDGIVIGASGVTLDLNGHTVDGTGAGAGIRSSADDILVRGGTVRQFFIGVRLDGGTDARVTGIAARDNGLFGISLSDVSRTRLERNVTRGTRLGGGIAVTEGSREVRVERNTSAGDRRGILVFEATERTVLARNTVLGAHEVGVSMGGLRGIVAGNRVVGAGTDGISIAAAGVLVARNAALRNAGHGIDAPNVALDGGGNVAGGNATDPQCIGVVCR